MKLLKLLSVLLLSITFFSCSKNNSTPSGTKSIEGTWVGKYSLGNTTPDKYYSFVIKSDGTFQEVSEAGAVTGQGTWEMDHNIFTGEYKTIPGNKKYSVIGAFNAAQAKILGDWGYDQSATNGGSWHMDKKN